MKINYTLEEYLSSYLKLINSHSEIPYINHRDCKWRKKQLAKKTP